MINWSIAKVFIGDEKFSVGVCVNFIESVIAITLAGLYIPHITCSKSLFTIILMFQKSFFLLFFIRVFVLKHPLCKRLPNAQYSRKPFFQWLVVVCRLQNRLSLQLKLASFNGLGFWASFWVLNILSRSWFIELIDYIILSFTSIPKSIGQRWTRSLLRSRWQNKINW